MAWRAGVIGFGGIRKIIIPMVGLVSGVLLFLASFSMLLNSVIFNSEFQKETFDKLGIYGSIAELAVTFSSDKNILQDQYKPIVKNNMTPDMVSTNLKSLIDGLTSYFKGNTNALPDLHLAGVNGAWSVISNSSNNTSDNDSFVSKYRQDVIADSSPDALIDSSADTIDATSVQPFDGYEKINLRVLFMIFGERQITDIMLVIGLFQFILSYIPIFTILLFVSIFALLLHKEPQELSLWLQSTIVTYFLLCLAASCMIQLVVFLKLPYLLSLLNKFEIISVGVLTEYITYCTNTLSKYITYCANTLSVQIILLSTVLFCAVQAAFFLMGRTYQNSISNGCSHTCHTKPPHTGMTTVDKAHKVQSPKKASILIFILVILSSISIYIQTNAASQNFDDRNLGRATSFLYGNNIYYQITNARNDQVYLLDVKVIDSVTRLPVKNLVTNVKTTDRYGIEPNQCTTNSEGSAAFLLDKGCFKLVFDPVDSLTSYILPYWSSYEFEMTTPGKEELTVILDRQIIGMPYIKEATMQYIP